MTAVGSSQRIEPLQERDLGAVLALLASLDTEGKEDSPFHRTPAPEELRFQLARDERESGRTWFVLRDEQHGGVAAVAGFDPAAAGADGEVFLDGPVVWLDARRQGLASALMQRVHDEVQLRLPSSSIRASVREANAAGTHFLESQGFLLQAEHRTFTCKDAHERRVALPEGVSIITPADLEEHDLCLQLLSREPSSRQRGREEFQQVASDRTRVLRLALAGNEPVAYCEASLDLLDRQAWIERLTEHPTWRETGLAAAILGETLNAVFAESRIQRARTQLTRPVGLDDRMELVFRGQGFATDVTELDFLLPA